MLRSTLPIVALVFFSALVVVPAFAPALATPTSRLALAVGLLVTAVGAYAQIRYKALDRIEEWVRRWWTD